MWNIETRPRFDEWFLDMEEEDQANVRASLYVLADKGAQLGRPNADTLNGSKHERTSSAKQWETNSRIFCVRS